jgi:tripartite-type tricarboxylate transporter receptor subunit TctC
VTYAHAGVGGATHVGMEEFAMAAGIQLNAIAYKGGAAALQRHAGRPGRHAGRLQLLGAARRRRQAAPAGHLGRTAHAALQGHADAQGAGLQGGGRCAQRHRRAQAGLPADVEKKLRDAFRFAVNSDEFKAVADKIDAPVMYLDGPDYQKYVAQVYDRETQLIQRLKLKELLEKG